MSVHVFHEKCIAAPDRKSAKICLYSEPTGNNADLISEFFPTSITKIDKRDKLIKKTAINLGLSSAHIVPTPCKPYPVDNHFNRITDPLSQTISFYCAEYDVASDAATTPNADTASGSQGPGPAAPAPNRP